MRLRQFLQMRHSVNDIIFTIDTTKAGSASDTFIFPMTVVPNSTMKILHGDGSSSLVTNLGDAGLTKVYSVGGIYEVTIVNGAGMEFAFNNLGDKSKLISIEQWGVTKLIISNFYGCDNLATITATDAPTLGTSLLNVFRSATSLSYIEGLNTWDYSSVITFQEFLRNTIIDQDLNFNSTSGITFTFLIGDNAVFNSQIVLDLSVATGISFITLNCLGLDKALDLDFSNIISMQSYHFGCSSLISVPLLDLSAGLNLITAWSNCALDTTSIDNIMQSCVNGGQSGLSTSVAGGTSLGFASWSAGAVTNYNTLIADGWTIATNA